MASFRRFVATSNSPLAKSLRALYYGVKGFSLPAPRILVRPILLTYLAIREVYFFVCRVFIAEPMFKAYCKSYGKGLKTDIYIHWVQGAGAIILGDNVLVDGKCSFAFAARFSDQPTLEVGNNTGIGAGCSFMIAKHIKIGSDCLIAPGSTLFDSNGHPTDPELRRKGLPPNPEEIRPVVIGDNVWVGRNSFIFPGTTIGEGAVIAANSVVRGNVKPFTVVAGNPARKVADLPRPAVEAPLPKSGEGETDNKEREHFSTVSFER